MSVLPVNCLVAACDNADRIARGMCPSHYAKWRRHGDPLYERQLKGCGTPAGYHYHKNTGTVPCGSCASAYRVHHRKKQQDRRRRDEEVRGQLAKELKVFRDSLGRQYTKRGRGYLTLTPQTTQDFWKDDAVCFTNDGPDFHTDYAPDVEAAIRMCRICPVIEECRTEQWLIQAPGVWAGIRWIPSHTSKGTVKPDSRYWHLRPRVAA